MKISKFDLTEVQPGIYTATDNDGTEGQWKCFTATGITSWWFATA